MRSVTFTTTSTYCVWHLKYPIDIIVNKLTQLNLDFSLDQQRKKGQEDIEIRNASVNGFGICVSNRGKWVPSLIRRECAEFHRKIWNGIETKLNIGKIDYWKKVKGDWTSIAIVNHVWIIGITSIGRFGDGHTHSTIQSIWAPAKLLFMPILGYFTCNIVFFLFFSVFRHRKGTRRYKSNWIGLIQVCKLMRSLQNYRMFEF